MYKQIPIEEKVLLINIATISTVNGNILRRLMEHYLSTRVFWIRFPYRRFEDNVNAFLQHSCTIWSDDPDKNLEIMKRITLDTTIDEIFSEEMYQEVLNEYKFICVTQSSAVIMFNDGIFSTCYLFLEHINFLNMDDDEVIFMYKISCTFQRMLQDLKDVVNAHLSMMDMKEYIGYHERLTELVSERLNIDSMDHIC